MMIPTIGASPSCAMPRPSLQPCRVILNRAGVRRSLAGAESKERFRWRAFYSASTIGRAAARCTRGTASTSARFARTWRASKLSGSTSCASSSSGRPFSPHPDRMDDTTRCAASKRVMARIAAAGLQAMPTLFCGHMSGVNWLPRWTLDRDTTHGRFRTIAGGRISPLRHRRLLRRSRICCARRRCFAQRVGERVRDHPALYAWDLGNEFSNLRDAGRRKTRRAVERASDRDADPKRPAPATTGGMHGEDLERDRHIRPSSIARPWVFPTMHGYSVYSKFARDRIDPNVVPFLCSSSNRAAASPCSSPSSAIRNARREAIASTASRVSMKPRWPSTPARCGSAARARRARRILVVLGRLRPRRSRELPPFDKAPHELRFGIVRSDGSFKPVAHVLAAHCRARHVR